MSQSQNDSVEKASQPTLCSNGCGFYSNVGTGGLCSKCFREQQAEEGKKNAAVTAVAEALKAPTTGSSNNPQPSVSFSPATAAAAAQPAAAQAAPVVVEAAPPKPSPTRCLTCNKKVGLTGFQCKCNPDAVFCSQHRYAEAHSCTFDYKAAQRQQLAEKNPVVQAAKLQKF